VFHVEDTIHVIHVVYQFIFKRKLENNNNNNNMTLQLLDFQRIELLNLLIIDNNPKHLATTLHSQFGCKPNIFIP